MKKIVFLSIAAGTLLSVAGYFTFSHARRYYRHGYHYDRGYHVASDILDFFTTAIVASQLAKSDGDISGRRALEVARDLEDAVKRALRKIDDRLQRVEDEVNRIKRR